MKPINTAKYLLQLVILYCLLSVGFSCLAQTSSPAVAVNEWKRYELSTGAFSVLLPGQPVEMHLPPPATMVVPLDQYSYSVVTDKGMFITTRTLIGTAAERWSSAADAAYYDGFWDAFTASMDEQMEANKLPYKTSLLERKKASLSGYDGQQMVFTVGALQGRVLITRIGRHSFVAAVLRHESTPAEDVEKFFSSFTISQSWLSKHQPSE